MLLLACPVVSFAVLLGCHSSLISSANVALHHLRRKDNALGAIAVHLGGAALLCVEMILTRLARNNLPLAGNFEALRK